MRGFPPIDLPDTKKIAIFCHKGGVGKSTTAASLACNLARMNHGSEVATLIDADPQGDLAALMDFPLENVTTTREALLNTRLPYWPSFRLPIKTKMADSFNADACVDFTPSSASLEQIDEEIRKEGFETFYRVRGMFFRIMTDYAVINCSSSLCPLNKAIIAASDYVIIPTMSEPLSLPAVAKTVDFVDKIAAEVKTKKDLDPTIGVPRILGILICRDEGFNINRETQEVLRETYPELVFDTVIRKTVLMQSDILRGMLKDPLARNTAAADYLDFAKETVSRIQKIEENGR